MASVVTRTISRPTSQRKLMDVVDERLVEDQLSGAPHVVPVAMHAANVVQTCRARRPRRQLHVRRVVHTHQTELQQPMTERHLGIDDSLARLGARPPAASRTGRGCLGRTRPSPALRGCLPAKR